MNIMFKPCEFKDSLKEFENSSSRLCVSEMSKYPSPLESVALTVSCKLIQMNLNKKNEDIKISYFTTNVFEKDESIDKLYNYLFKKCIKFEILYISPTSKIEIDKVYMIYIIFNS